MNKINSYVITAVLTLAIGTAPRAEDNNHDSTSDDVD